MRRCNYSSSAAQLVNLLRHKTKQISFCSRLIRRPASKTLTLAQPRPRNNALRMPQDGPVDHATLEAEHSGLRFRGGEKCAC